MKRWLKEPLLHFLLAGAAMFVIASAMQGPDTSGRNIQIGREELLVFMQGRAQVYDDETFAALLEDMSDDDRRLLIRDAALQEALYREGQALDLAEADPLIRQRVVQQMRLLLMEEAAAGIDVSEDEARDYYERNSARYAVDPSITFTHVFLRDGTTRAEAEAMLRRLREDNVEASAAGEYGDRFLYQLNYAEAPPALVAGHFGDDFSAALFQLDAGGGWQGPIRSEHGWHLVLPVRFSAARAPAFDEIADRVREDLLADRRQEAADAALDRMLAHYEIELTDGLQR